MLALVASLGGALVLDAPVRSSAATAALTRRQQPVHMKLDYDPATYDPERGGLSTLASERPEGSHSTGFRFMPLSTMAKDASTALVCVAGLFPGLTADDLLRPQPLPFAPAGKWNYHVLTGEACSTGFVALPGSVLLERHPDTVAVVCGSKSLGIEFPDDNEHEVLALIDRSDIAVFKPDEFDNKAFYAFGDEAGQVHIRWMEAVPAGWRLLGRLLYTQMPLVYNPNKASGFAENEDEFEF